MALSAQLQDKVIDFLTSIPGIHEKNKRNALIVKAMLGKTLEALINYDGESIVFFPLLVKLLISHKTLEDGRDALEALLEAAKSLVGPEEKQNCDRYIMEWRKCRQVQPVEAKATREVAVSEDHHNIWISYAKADEKWVDNLIHALRIQLGSFVGENTFSIIKTNHQSQRQPISNDNDVVNVEQANALILILSSAYIDSKKCDTERAEFLRHSGQDGNPLARVFVIELEKATEYAYPQELMSCQNRYQFWGEDQSEGISYTLGKPKPNPTDPQDAEYYNRLNDLGRDLKNTLKPPPPPEQQDNRSAVFLAEVTNDLVSQRDEAKRALDQAGFRVVSVKLDIGEPVVLQQNVMTILQGCLLFVQLLSTFPGEKRPGWSSYVALQYECAQQAGVPVLQWCNSLVNLEKVTDADYRRVLEGHHAMTVSLEEFKTRVIQQAKFESMRQSLPRDPFVFINADQTDSQFADEISNLLLQRKQVGSMLPDQQNDPFDQIAKYVSYIDGVIVVYGMVDVMWPQDQVIRFNHFKGIQYRRNPFLKLAVCECPPAREKLRVTIPGMHTIDCRQGISPEPFEPFLHDLKMGGTL